MSLCECVCVWFRIYTANIYFMTQISDFIKDKISDDEDFHISTNISSC